MICQACGNPVEAGVHFCPRCGAQVAAPPPPPAAYPPMYAMRPPRVQRNIQTLGILWCVFGAYRILAGLFGIAAMRVLSERQFNHYGWTWNAHINGLFTPPWMNAFVPLIFLTMAVTAILAFLAGYSLLTRRSWGRVLAIVVAILALLKFPVGTALGIYTLWVLAPAASGAEYDAIAEP